MQLELSEQRWQGLRAALRSASDRFADLARSAPPPTRLAVGSWTAAETLAHTAIVAHLNAGVLRDPTAPLGVPDVDRLVPGTTLGDIAHLNEVALRVFPDRTPAALADHLRDGVAELLDRSATLDPRGPATWLGGARLPVAAVLAHQLNEILIHGHDIARARGSRWRISSVDAALAFELFLVRLLGTDEPGRLFGGAPAAGGGRRVAIEFRSRHTAPVVLAAGGGRASAQPPDGHADARVRFEPAALMLIVFRRRRLARALATGELVATGRRPWAAVSYLRGMRTP